ncbi:CBS domain-containing protein [Streptomyces sp. NK15101]|uniref:CBS domain-containing protein n=1 Tax=Streptomyces sp. NK15101 TaxID=2873261 RepID=UPI001CECF6B0|nr:CBS domain-containing protein [Streptomyces sp. NK15101]
MTPVQTQPRSTPAVPATRTVADTVDKGGLQVGDHMTVEVALAVMAGARAGRLLVCDDDGLCTGLVTPAQLTAVRDSPAYTDRLRLRDLPDDGAPRAGHAGHAGHAGNHVRLPVPCVMDERDGGPGAPGPVLALA